jgi:hypothetical protein
VHRPVSSGRPALRALCVCVHHTLCVMVSASLEGPILHKCTPPPADNTPPKPLMDLGQVVAALAASSL